MDGCYHDKQDFKSDLNIEVAREGDILKEGQDLKDIKCDKNPGHRDFIPFKDLTLEQLPIEHRSRETLDMIKKTGSVVVRLVVEKIVNGRQITEAGSGYVMKLDNGYFILTNNHVVKTEDDVKHCTVEFHYDDVSRSSVLASRGVELDYTCPYRDVTLFTFHPVPDFLHQLDLNDDDVASIVILYKNDEIVTDSILRLMTPQMVFYSTHDLNSQLIDFMFVTSPDNSISYIKSSYFKFQPIPSNIQELTHIEIHIDDEDGNSRVRTGDVVQFGDEFVVKISESIFQDEVKKCRLVWNGEVIGRGTRLYFKQVKSSDVYSGIDLELQMEQGIENYWLFELHPIPTFLENDTLDIQKSNNMCCIGHPHGGIKMVTIGRWLGNFKQQFDKQYRRISKPNPDCQCNEVGCVRYSCKTCQGSSGSPVFVLREGMNLNSNIIHFMGKATRMVLPNGELIENINTAWLPTAYC